MDYLKIYTKLIVRASGRSLKTGYEEHHFLPKSLITDPVAQQLLGKISLFGERTKRVRLTYREHLLVHLLLIKIFEKISKNCYQKMLFAANMMRTTREKIFISNSKKYLWLKEKFVQMMVVKGTGHPSGASGKKWSDEAKKTKSDNHPAKGKTYEEYYGEEEAKRLKELRRQSKLGIVLTEETKQKIRDKKQNVSEETRLKISLSRKGKPLPLSVRKKISDFMGNDKLNPSVDQTIYEFINKNTGEKIWERKIDMRKKYKCLTIHHVVRDKTRSSKGWMFTGNMKEK